MKREFPSVRWIVFAAINVQCLTFYIWASVPSLRLAPNLMGTLAWRLAWWSAALFAIGLFKFPGTSMDRFGRSVMILASAYSVLIAGISQWGMALSAPRVVDCLAIVSAPVQVLSVWLFVRKIRRQI